jgi:ribosomal protein S18 acetylase RimI-like enzyme
MYEYKIMDAGHYEEAYKLWEKNVGIGPNDTKDEIKKYLARNTGMSFVCIERSTGKVIGAILGGNDGRHGYIYHLAVNSEHRFKGIARTLVVLSTEALKKAGIRRCIIGVKGGNNNFWDKIGWKKLEELNMYSVVM